jgi:hypothetical protein
MGFWSDLLGVAPSSPAQPAATGEAAAAPIELAASRPRRGTDAWHRDRFANALPQYRVMLERGETTAERIAKLERWHAYYAARAAAEEAMGIAPAARDDEEIG